MHGREKEEQIFLCPNCSFNVKEGIQKTLLGVKIGYLGNTIAASRQALPRLMRSEHSGWLRLGLLLLFLGCIGLLTVAISSPSMWFFSSEIMAVFFVILCVGLNHMIDFSQSQIWLTRLVDVGCIALGSSVVWPLPEGWETRWVWSCCLVAVAGALAREAVLMWQQYRRRLASAPLKDLDKPVEVPTRLEREKEEEEMADDVEDAFVLGAPGRGWSSRKAAFQFQPGEYEPGVMHAGIPKRAPSEDELRMESLMQKVSILGDEGGEDDQTLNNKILLQAGKKWWDSAPRMTLGMLLLAMTCRVVFWTRSWGSYVYILFMGLALMALQIESMSHRRELSIALAGMISASVVPWKNSLTWLLSNIEVIGLLLIGLLVVLFRNKK